MSPHSTGDESVLWQAAVRVLDANWTGDATIPSPGLYPHQWGWDSAFVSMGLARYRQDRAERELVSLFRGQWANGLVPHIVFNPALERHAYFPGPELWRSAKQAAAPRQIETSGITTPPLHALAALRVYRCSGDAEAGRDFLARMYPLLVAQHRHLATSRDLGGGGLMSICHPWESGLDNSPVWDLPLAALQLPPSTYAPGRGLRGLPTGADYDRYVWLVTTLRDAGYGDEHLRDVHPFAVEDPLVNAVYLASTHALVEIAGIVGGDPGPHREAAGRIHDALLDRLWDEEAGCFRAWDVRGARRLPIATVAAFGPLLDPELAGRPLRALVDLLLSARFAGAAGYPVPTCDIQSPMFDRASYGRGPTWININWLIWLGATLHDLPVVADLMYASTLRLVRQSGFREFFDPFDGTGRGSNDFSGSAALILDLLAARRAPRAA
jgi:glycogen debranching enzyme